MVRRMGGVEEASAVKSLEETVRRTDRIDEAETGGIVVMAADPGLARTLGARVRRGDVPQSRRPPTTRRSCSARPPPSGSASAGRASTCGSATAGSASSASSPRSRSTQTSTARPDWLPGRGAAVRRRPLAHEHLRARADDQVEETRDLLAATANPEHPEEVEVSRPSDALAAEAAAKSAFTALFLGLGAVALVVGGVGIANVMVISVLERRSEIGLRRALGATRRHIAAQFLTESLLLALLGGLAGRRSVPRSRPPTRSSQGWPAVVPAVALAGAFGAALAIGALAGLYPAARAARLAPTEALRSV